MFVRVKRRKLSRNLGYSLHAVLVESFRRKGEPRQKIVCYLGSIRENELPVLTIRKEFTTHAHHKIDSLNLLPHESSKLKISLSKMLYEYTQSK